MNRAFWATVLRDNWHLLILFVVVLSALAYVVLTRDMAGTMVNAESQQTGANLQTPRYANVPRPTLAEEASEFIREHEAYVEQNPDSEEVPARLYAAGNLYRQRIRDYAAAAEKYEMILANYPDWVAIHSVYPQLEHCYVQLGDQSALIELYKEMMRNMPPDSQEYLYAKTQLGLAQE